MIETINWNWHGTEGEAGRATYNFVGGSSVTVSLSSLSEARELAEAIDRDREATRKLARIGLFGEIRQIVGR